MKMVLHIVILNLKILSCLMAYVNCVILDGPLSAIRGEKRTVEHLTMQLHKFYKAKNTTCQSICGAWEF